MKVIRLADNQYVIASWDKRVLQSYDKIIAVEDLTTGAIALDRDYWDYSRTTGKYRNKFLGETKKETLDMLKKHIYYFDNLNK